MNERIEHINNVINTIINDPKNANNVKEYKEGRTGLLGYFCGLTMKELKNDADPKYIIEIIKINLGK